MEAHQLTPILKSMLLKFYRRNGGSKPTRILFYRDGVSEGQFKEVNNNNCLYQNPIFERKHQG